MASENVIEVRNLVVEYSSEGKKRRAVNDITFHVRQGECVGFIGPNGAGKSSTIKTLMGFIFPASGSVSLFGQPAGTVASKMRIGYLPEVTLYYPFLKAGELLRLYGGLHRVPKKDLARRIPQLLEAVGLSGVDDKLIRTFSKGMQQRLGIAQALISQPECLIFDELNSGLDPVGRHDLRNVLLGLKQQGTTIFFSSHELHEVEALCDRVIAVNQGNILFDYTIGEFREKAADNGLEEYFMSLVRPRESWS